ncbi:phage major capsid protein [Notoacmeibacter sp. MSK16QG-6]|uniref:phage major capsid protein n=1 Tax=Notoacmeibacter sp. MSK16QG-6 TaxID=2957982 RepID=UPI00209EC30E|nr:phage major capsid protein [Notoacmeibacter sp. MSK16QG-6]MCP1198135.1 phage major capsid protein [Notoacmeibacter sp. MSK16QG-6]
MQFETSQSAPEIKAASGSAVEVAEAFDEFMGAFEAFKSANDERLNEIERRVTADVVTNDKVERINNALTEQKQALDRLMVKGARPGMGGAPYSTETKSAFHSWMRSGDESAIRAMETKAMNIGAGAEGGYLVPPETETEIGKRLAELSPIRSIASVRQVSSSVLKKPFSVAGPATGWVAETDVRPETSAGTLAELNFPTMELYAMPAATTALLDDAAVDLDAWIAAEVEAAFAEQEGEAFVKGDGVNKPRGFLSYGSVAEENWNWGALGHIATGVDGDLPAADASDVLIDTVYALKAGYRQNAHWVMNRRTQAAIRKLKDSDGNYLWTPPATVGAKAMLMGFPVVEAEDMPDADSAATPIAFGDFQRGYLIVDRVGVRVLRDPYSAKPYVLFYTTKRVGGGVQDFDAIKLVKYAA